MRHALIPSLLFWSIVLTGQTGTNKLVEISPSDNFLIVNHENVKPVLIAHFKEEESLTLGEFKSLNNPTINNYIYRSVADVAVKNPLAESSKYKKWIMVSMLDLSVGYGSYNSTLTNPGTKYGVHGSMGLGSFNIGFRKLAGLGFGTNVNLVYGMPGVEIDSWFPLYMTLPLFISKETTKPSPFADSFNVTSMINLYAGGSLWCSENSIFSEDCIMPEKFYQIGVSYMFFNYYFEVRILHSYHVYTATLFLLSIPP